MSSDMRTALLDALGRCDVPPGPEKTNFTIAFAAGWNAAANPEARADSAVPSSHVSAWISVDERMPVGDVLLCTTSRVCIIGDWYIDGWRTHRSVWEDRKLVHAYRREDITHWMPLPEPPLRAAASPMSTASAPANSETDVLWVHDFGGPTETIHNERQPFGEESEWTEFRRAPSNESILREALARLVAKLEVIEEHPKFKGVWPYLWAQCPQWTPELEAARSALAGIPLNASGDRPQHEIDHGPGGIFHVPPAPPDMPNASGDQTERSG